MENPLHEAHEHIEHAEEGPKSRLKVVITVMILVVTMLTTLAGVMAGIWSARESETQRERQQSATESLRSGLAANTQLQATDSAIDDATEATWRQTFLHTYSVEVTDKALSTELQQQADSAAQVASQINKRLPGGARSQAYTDRLNQHSLRESQLAGAYAQQSAGWLEKNNGALAVVSMLALSLFLLGLALTLANRPTQIGFTALAVVMTVIAGARLIQVHVSTIAAPTESCIETDGAALAKLNLGKYDGAETELETVLHKCPSYVAAWSDLGDTYFYRGIAQAKLAKSSWPKAEVAAQKAVDVSDADSAALYNELGFMQVLNHDYDAAAVSLTKAHRLSPESHVILASLAELAIARGDRRTAYKYLEQAVDGLRDAGPYLRDDYFFRSLRYDRTYFPTAGITGPKIDEFFRRGRQAEAFLDSQDMASPLDTHGASITGLIFKRSDSVLGRTKKFVTIGFSYHGLKVGDVISLRFYGYDDSTFDPTASLTTTVETGDSLVGSGVERPDTDFRLKLSYPYETTMEVYLNGVSQGQVSLSV